MFILPTITWFLAAAAFLAALTYYWKSGSICGFTTTAFLGAIMLPRPIMFAFGWDVTFPPGINIDYAEPMTLTYLLYIFWIASFFIAHFALRPLSRSVSGIFPLAPARIDRNIILTVASVATFVGVFGTLLLAMEAGSVARFMYAVKIGKELAGSYVIRETTVVASLICLIGLISEIRSEKLGKSRTIFIFTLLLISNMASNYLWGNRSNIAYTIIVGAMAYHVFVKPLTFRFTAIGIILAAAMLQSLAFLRTDLTASVRGVASHLDDLPFWTALSTTLHLVEFDAFMLAVRDAGTAFPFRLGEDFYNGLVSWIPRQLWADKPGTFHIGAWFRQVYQPDRVNGWPVTLVGGWYVNFSTIGVFLGGLLSGVVVRAVDLRYSAIARRNAYAAVLAPAFGIFLLRGGYDTGTPQDFVLIVLPLAILALLLRLKTSTARNEIETGELTASSLR